MGVAFMAWGWGVAGGGQARQKHGARGWRAGLWGRLQQAAWGEQGLGMGWEAQFWSDCPRNPAFRVPKEGGCCP